MTAQAALAPGLVVASHGRHAVVETPTGQRLICHPRGKKSQVVVGDRVRWLASQDEGTIEKIEPRRNLFYRQDEVRIKSFAANLDQVLILIAAEPEFSEKQLARALIAAEAEHITPLIALNKSDLAEPFARAWHRLEPYRQMGYAVLPLCLKAPTLGTGVSSLPPEGALAPWDGPAALKPATESAPSIGDLPDLLKGKTTLVLGPSGAGKSTLINLLAPGAQALTNEISAALNSGRHTTTSTTWYWADAARSTALIDSPGFQEFGLQHIDPAHLAGLMPDFKPWLGHCRFYNCTHLHEPGCAVLAQLQSKSVPAALSASRHRIYQELFAELSQTRY